MAEDTYTVVRSTTIAAPPPAVYEHVADFHRWRAWSPWEDIDPTMERTFAGADSGRGAVYAWKGNRKAGQGRMEIVDVIEPSRVVIDLVFEKPFTARNETVFTIEPDGPGSRVSWTMTGRKTLITKVMAVVRSMDKMVGPDFEKGLRQLKATVESQAAT